MDKNVIVRLDQGEISTMKIRRRVKKGYFCHRFCSNVRVNSLPRIFRRLENRRTNNLDSEIYR